MNKDIPFCIHLCFTSETIKLVTEAFVIFLRMYMPTTIFPSPVLQVGFLVHGCF